MFAADAPRLVLLLLARRPSTRRPDEPRPAPDVPGVHKPNPSAMSNVPKPDASRPAPDVPGLHKQALPVGHVRLAQARPAPALHA